MTHDELKEKIFLARDREVPEPERQELEDHLRSCKECTTAFNRWETLVMTLQKAARSPAPNSEAFVQKVMSRLSGQNGRPGWFPLWRIPALGAALASLLFVALLNLRQEPLSLDDLLLVGSEPNGFSQFILETGEPSPEEILEIKMEDL
jgi:anti-sigma factor RsiW